MCEIDSSYTPRNKIKMSTLVSIIIVMAYVETCCSESGTTSANGDSEYELSTPFSSDEVLNLPLMDETDSHSRGSEILLSSSDNAYVPSTISEYTVLTALSEDKAKGKETHHMNELLKRSPQSESKVEDSACVLHRKHHRLKTLRQKNIDEHEMNRRYRNTVRKVAKRIPNNLGDSQSDNKSYDSDIEKSLHVLQDKVEQTGKHLEEFDERLQRVLRINVYPVYKDINSHQKEETIEDSSSPSDDRHYAQVSLLFPKTNTQYNVGRSSIRGNPDNSGFRAELVTKGSDTTIGDKCYKTKNKYNVEVEYDGIIESEPTRNRVCAMIYGGSRESDKRFKSNKFNYKVKNQYQVEYEKENKLKDYLTDFEAKPGWPKDILNEDAENPSSVNRGSNDHILSEDSPRTDHKPFLGDGNDEDRTSDNWHRNHHKFDQDGCAVGDHPDHHEPVGDMFDPRNKMHHFHNDDNLPHHHKPFHKHTHKDDDEEDDDDSYEDEGCDSYTKYMKGDRNTETDFHLARLLNPGSHIVKVI